MESRKLRQGESRKLRQGESRCKIRCLFKLQSIEGRFVLLCDKSTKNVGASEMPPHPSTSEGGALREPRAKQSNGFLAYALPSAARRRTPARCCARFLAYAPAIKSPARYRAGRAKQHNHARNVKPLSPSGSPRGTPRGQEGGGLCPLPCPANLSVMLTLPCPGALPLPFIFSLAGTACRRSPARFLLAKKGRNPVPLCSVA